MGGGDEKERNSKKDEKGREERGRSNGSKKQKLLSIVKPKSSGWEEKGRGSQQGRRGPRK